MRRYGQKRFGCWLIVGLLAAGLCACTAEPAAELPATTETTALTVQTTDELSSEVMRTSTEITDTKSTTKKTSVEGNGTMIDKAYLIANSNASEEDFAGVDVADFVAFWSLDESNIAGSNIQNLVKAYKEMKQKKEEQIDYSEILQATEPRRTFDENAAAQVDTLAVMVNSNSQLEEMVFDFHNKICIFGRNMEMFSHCENGTIEVMDDATAQEVKTSIRQAHIETWKPVYDGTDEGTTGSQTWLVALDLADGTRLVYTGSGVMGDNAPQTLYPFVRALRQIGERNETPGDAE